MPDVSIAGFMRSAQRARTQQPEGDGIDVGAVSRLLDRLNLQNAAFKSELDDARESLASAQAEVARLTEANTHLQRLADSHRADAQRHSTAAETARARADEHATARRAADVLAQREREARIVAESKPPRVEVIREPPQIVNVPAFQAAPSRVDHEPVRGLPSVPKKLSVRVLNRDPNGFMQHVELIPGD